MKHIGLLLTTLLSVQAYAELPRSPAPEGAKSYIVSPADGDTVPTNFKVVFGLEGMGVAPAGIQSEHTGHHHLLINADALPDLGQPLGTNVTHFGKGQTETELSLAPGEHTLQLILADHYHIPHQPPVVSEKITITVK